MRLKLRAALALAACLLAAHAAAAQTSQSEQPIKLSLRLIIYSGAAPTFYPLGDGEGMGGGGIIRDFRRLPSAPLKGGLPPDSVSVGFSRKGTAARVTVDLLRVSESASETQRVAEFLLAEGQERAVAEMAAYGVEPLLLSVVRRAEVRLAPPRVENRTQSVEVREVKVHPESPSFELVLRNASDKQLRAVEIEEYRGWNPKGPPPAYDWRQSQPVGPGKTLNVTLEFGWNGKVVEGEHVAEPPDRVVIRSALFADGSYEGDSRFAARAAAFREGRRIQLGRVMEMLREPGATAGDYAFVQHLTLRVQELESVADWSAVSGLAERYLQFQGDELERLKGMVESGMKLQRGVVLVDLQIYFRSASPASDPALTGRWLEALRKRYEKMLADN